MKRNPTISFIFQAAGVIVILVAFGYTFFFPPVKSNKFYPPRDKTIEIGALLPSVDAWVPRREEVVRYPMGGPNHECPPDPWEKYFPYSDYDEPPSIIKECRPIYPPEERKTGAEGDVVLLAYIDEGGKVTKVIVRDSPGEQFMEIEAIEATLNCEFESAIKDGEPIGTWYHVVMQFRL
jgi:TonB family protein